MSAHCDVAVLGGGIEGLACAASLARGGAKVVVLERAAALGGTAARAEFHPGYRMPGLVPDAALARRALLAPLELEARGLRWRAEMPAVYVPGDAGLLMHRDPQRMDSLAADERARYAALRASLARYAPILADLVDAEPPDIAEPSPKELWNLGQTAFRLRRLGQQEMFALMRLLPSSASDWLKESLEEEALRVALAAPALIGSLFGPRSPATSALIFLRECLSGPEPVGGPSALADALVARCRELGVELRTGAEVRAVRLDKAGVTGVELAQGEAVECTRVASSLSPATTLLELLPAGAVPQSAERAVASWRAHGTTAVLRLALSRPPKFRGAENALVEHAVSARSLDDLERAADALKYKSVPARPWVEVRVPSHADASLAPAGGASVAVSCHTAPRDLRGGWTDRARAELERAMLVAFDEIAPGASAAAVGRELLTPVDIEARYGAQGGHIFGGELALDQLWLQRPSLELCRYATPIAGLYLCGSGSHPGGPFRGGAGVLAARAMLASR